MQVFSYQDEQPRRQKRSIESIFASFDDSDSESKSNCSAMTAKQLYTCVMRTQQLINGKDVTFHENLYVDAQSFACAHVL